MREIATADYWNKRVKETPDLKDMLFKDPRREEFWRRVRNQLELWKDKNVLDVCCGYGQFSQIFNPLDYTGLDVSIEMLKLAKSKDPHRQFLHYNILTDTWGQTHDVVFEVNSLHSLGLTPQEFYEKFKNNAKIIACLEADIFTIFQNY